MNLVATMLVTLASDPPTSSESMARILRDKELAL
jgi:hypothetical protein